MNENTPQTALLGRCGAALGLLYMVATHHIANIFLKNPFRQKTGADFLFNLFIFVKDFSFSLSTS